MGALDSGVYGSSLKVFESSNSTHFHLSIRNISLHQLKRRSLPGQVSRAEFPNSDLA